MTKAYVLASIGILLLACNIAGLVIPLRTTPVLRYDSRGNTRSEVISPKELYVASNANYSNRADYACDLTEAVGNAISHSWKDSQLDKYHLRIPIYENYILWALSYINPNQFRKYEFTDYNRAIERGVGMCSQKSIVLAELLRHHGLQTNIVGLNGHVVVRAQVDPAHNEWWILDPDWIVVIRHDLAFAETHPRYIKNAYLSRLDEQAAEEIAAIYGHDGNRIAASVRDYSTRTYYIERISYVLIWIFPAILICAGALIFRRDRVARAAER